MCHGSIDSRYEPGLACQIIPMSNGRLAYCPRRVAGRVRMLKSYCLLSSPYAQGMELKQRVVASPDLQTAFGGSTLSALQNTYSLSISYAQARMHTALRARRPMCVVTSARCVSCSAKHPSFQCQASNTHVGCSRAVNAYNGSWNGAHCAAINSTHATSIHGSHNTLLFHADSGSEASGPGHHSLVPAKHRVQGGGRPAFHHHYGLH